MPIGSSYDEKPQTSIAAASTAMASQEEELEETNQSFVNIGERKTSKLTRLFYQYLLRVREVYEIGYRTSLLVYKITEWDGEQSICCDGRCCRENWARSFHGKVVHRQEPACDMSFGG